MNKVSSWLKHNKKLFFALCGSLLLLFCLYTSLFINAFINGDATVSLMLAIDSIRNHGFNISSIIVSFVVCGVIACIIIYRLTTNDDPITHPIDKNRTYSDKDNYGKAQFEKPEEYRNLAQIRSIDKCIGHIYGMLDKEGRECIDFFPDPKDPEAHINNHIFAIGASGSGKTYTTGLTYCLQSIKMEHSVIHTDPKGELFATLANTYRQHGYVVRRLNFINPSKSDGWDCMKAIRTIKDEKKKAELVDKFIAAITTQLSDKPDDIFSGAGPGMLLRAIILRLVFDPTIPNKDKTIKKVYEILKSAGGLAAIEKEYFLKENVPVEAQQCIGPWEIFNGGSDKLKGNILLNLTSGGGFGVLNTPSIADLISTDDIDIALPGDEKCAYFIQFPVPNTAYRFPTALFFTMLFETLQDKATANSDNNRKLNREVDFYLDEFGQIGVLPAWGQRMSVVRSYGLNVFMIIQTMAQFKNNYLKDYETIMSNCATWLMLGVNDMESAKMFSDCIGQTTISVETVSEEIGPNKVNMFGTKKVSRGTGKTPLLSPSEIKTLPPNTLIILMQRHNPIYANSVPHIWHPYAKDMEPTNDNIEPYFYDQDNLYEDFPIRAERRSKEQQTIADYKNTHEPYIQPDNIDDVSYRKRSDIFPRKHRETKKERQHHVHDNHQTKRNNYNNIILFSKDIDTSEEAEPINCTLDIDTSEELLEPKSTNTLPTIIK